MSTTKNKPALVLLAGWGLQGRVLQPLADALESGMQVHRLPLPDFNQPDWAEWLQRQIPPHSWLCGWSLGGMLACRMAAVPGLQAAGLITLASNACFVARPDWPQAMAAETFARFVQSVQQQPAATLKQFSLLCSQGDAQPRLLARQLQGYLLNPADLAGLELLGQLDNRALLAELQLPQLHLLAEQDSLVPAAVAADLQQLNPRAGIITTPGSHAFVHSHAQQLAQQISRFIGSDHG